jgi:hypothetical protein
MIGSGEHPSLLWYNKNYGRLKFYSASPFALYKVHLKVLMALLITHPNYINYMKKFVTMFIERG